MYAIWVLAKKELRLLLRDRMAAGLLLFMPLLFILILGLLLGESFGQKPDDTLRLSIVDLDGGPGILPSPPLLLHATVCGLLAAPNGQGGWLAAPVTLLVPDWRSYPIPDPERVRLAGPGAVGLGATGNPLASLPAIHTHFTSYPSWSAIIREDLKETPGIRLEIIPTRAEAEKLIRQHRRAAVLVLRNDFTDRIHACSFLSTPFSVNPFHREGVYLQPGRVNLGLELLRDETQSSAASIIEQVVQVSMLRVILPYMIGQAFLKLSEPRFIDRLGQEVRLPLPPDFPELVDSADFFLKLLEKPRVKSALGTAALFDSSLRGIDKRAKRLEERLERFRPLIKHDRVQLKQMIDLASGSDAARAEHFRASVGDGVQGALRYQFRKYDLTGMTWAALTRSQADREGAQVSDYEDRAGSGLLRRGAHRYQILVPSYTVMFAFFLVLTVGWVFVAERRQGTLKRLRAAPLTRAQILLGKLVPCYLISLGQGVFLLVAGRLLFGMRWGPDSWPLLTQAGWLLLVVVSTSLAAMGLALLVSAVARSEVQVALFGAVPVLVLALIGGCVLPREMMPEQTQKFSLLTPQGWALDAYRELLNASAGYQPNLSIVLEACGVLGAFGLGFLALAWGLLRLD
jgi:ABC-type multidrug transport system permease subunit